MARRHLDPRRRNGWGRYDNYAEEFVANATLNLSGMRAAAAGDAGLANALCDNHRVTLPDEVWNTLWQRRGDLSLAQNAVARPLTETQLTRVLTDDDRLSVAVAALEHTTPTDAQAAAVAASPRGRAIARELPDADAWELSDATWRAWCLAAGSEAGLRWLTGHPDVDPAPYLADPAWVGRVTRRVRVHVARLLAVRPDAIGALCAPDADVALAAEAAASHLLAGRDDDALAIVYRDPCAPAHRSDTNTKLLWDAWMTLADNPFVSDTVIDALVAHYNAHAGTAAWADFVGTWGYWRRSTRAAGDAFPKAVAAGRKRRQAIGYDPAVGMASIATRTEYACAVETFNPLWRSSELDYCTLALAADALADVERPRHYQVLTGSDFANAIADGKQYVSVLGVDRVRAIIRSVGSTRRVNPRGSRTTTPRAGHYRPARRELDDSGSLPLYDLRCVDDAGAAVLGDALHSEHAWQALYSLLADADAGDDLAPLLGAAQAVSTPVG
jgi:hypothetical protein